MASAYAIDWDTNPQTIRPKYADFKDVALKTNTGILALHEAHNHNIVLQPRIISPHHLIYNLSENKLKVLYKYIETALNKGWI